jgi:hypothetical protein
MFVGCGFSHSINFAKVSGFSRQRPDFQFTLRHQNDFDRRSS